MSLASRYGAEGLFLRLTARLSDKHNQEKHGYPDHARNRQKGQNTYPIAEHSGPKFHIGHPLFGLLPHLILGSRSRVTHREISVHTLPELRVLCQKLVVGDVV